MTHGRCSSRSRPSPRSGGRATGPSYPGRHQPRSSRPYSAPSACTSSVLPVRSRAADSSDHPLVDTRPSRPAPTPRQSVLRSAPVLDGALHFDRADHHPDSPASDQPAALDPKEHGEAAEAPQLPWSGISSRLLAARFQAGCREFAFRPPLPPTSLAEPGTAPRPGIGATADRGAMTERQGHCHPCATAAEPRRLAKPGHVVSPATATTLRRRGPRAATARRSPAAALD
jgi:hypothetical protein